VVLCVRLVIPWQINNWWIQRETSESITSHSIIRSHRFSCVFYSHSNGFSNHEILLSLCLQSKHLNHFRMTQLWSYTSGESYIAKSFRSNIRIYFAQTVLSKMSKYSCSKVWKIEPINFNVKLSRQVVLKHQNTYRTYPFLALRKKQSMP
jgi:hypothetical protein